MTGVFLQHFKPYEFDFGHRVLDDFELHLSYLDHFVELGETLIFVQYQSANGHVFIAFGQVKVELFVYLVNLQASGKQVFVVAKFLGHKVRVVVLVLDVAEYLLHNVFQRNDAAGSAELIDDDGKTLLLLAGADPHRKVVEAARELGRHGPSTKAQQALSEAREAIAQERKADSRERREREQRERFHKRQEKRKRKRRGR